MASLDMIEDNGGGAVLSLLFSHLVSPVSSLLVSFRLSWYNLVLFSPAFTLLGIMRLPCDAHDLFASFLSFFSLSAPDLCNRIQRSDTPGPCNFATFHGRDC